MTTIRLNGAPHTIADGASVAKLLAAMRIDRAKVAVERNREIVPRSRFDDAALTEGDEIEIVHFVGGG